MEWVKVLICVVLTAMMLGISFQEREEVTSSNVSMDHQIHVDYLIGLEEQRGICYEHILYLGAIPQKDLIDVKTTLIEYLQQIQNLQFQLDSITLSDFPLKEALRVDSQILTNTVQAIETLDESYLEEQNVLYKELLIYIQQLSNEFS